MVGIPLSSLGGRDEGICTREGESQRRNDMREVELGSIMARDGESMPQWFLRCFREISGHQNGLQTGVYG